MVFSQSIQDMNEGESLFESADSLLLQGKLMPAAKLFERALIAFEEMNDEMGILRVKTKQANIEGSLGNFKQSNSLIDQLLEAYEARYLDSLIIGKLYLAKGKNLRNIGILDEAEVWIRKSMANMEANQSMQAYAKAHLYLGIIKWDKNESDVEEHLLENMALFEKHFTNDLDMLGHPHHLLGVYKLHFGNLVASKDHFTKAVKYFEKGNDNISKGNGIFYLGIVDYNEKNYDAALENMEKAKGIFNSTYGPGHVRTTFVDNLMGNVHTDLGNHVLAEKYFDAAYVVRIEKYGPTHVETIAMLMNKSNAQLNQGNYQIALKSLKKTANLFEQSDIKTYDYFKVYKNIGTTYAKMKNFEQAKIAFEQAAKNGAQVLPNDAVQWIDLRLEQVLLSNSKDEALAYFDQAYGIFGIDEDIQDIPKDKFKDIIHPIYLFRTMVEKLSFLKKSHQAGNDIDQYDRTMELMDKALEVANFIRLDLENDGSRAQFFSLAKTLFHNYLDLTWLQQNQTETEINLSDINSIMEKSKAWILLEGLKDKRANSSFQIHDTVRTQIRDINIQIDERYQLITQIDETDFDKLNQVRSEIYDLRTRLQAIESEIQKDNPTYKFSDSNQETSFDQLNTYIADKNSLYIHYALTDQFIYIFGSNGSDAFLKREIKSDSFDQDILKLYTYIKDKHRDEIAYDALISSLSQQLIGPITSSLDSTESLIIVPDGLLHYLPFDLLTQRNQNKSLVYTHNISYAYSGTTLFELESSKNNSGSDFLALAPEFSGNGQMAMRGEITTDVKIIRADLPALQGAQDEASSINDLLNGNVLSSAAASEHNFKKFASGKGILHLATHAIIDDENPINSHLALARSLDGEEDGNLYLWELKNLDLKSQMTVLSACNTGYGKLQEGEGMISLGRAFLLAGSKSVVMSSWPAQDFSTKQIMIDFYQNLSNNMTKGAALRAAKLSYLESADKHMNHPFYWSGFSVNGLNDPIEFSSKSKFKNILLGLLILITLMSFIFFKIKSK